MRQPTQKEWPAIWQLFDKLVDLPEAQRQALLAAADPFVADQVRTLLRAEESEGPLDRSPGQAAQGFPSEYSSLAVGGMVGAFQIVKLIGRGGMGEVYLAERIGAGFAQRVALKLLRPEAVARAALFESERTLLATLEHPGIARLIDGGISDDGRAFMAMEYVDGEDIGQWCARTNATVDDRLRLFLDLCDAVSYAHARLVVHRDIKPANILIDVDGRARLLDFGIARLLEDGGADRTLTLALMTPDSAAPEQLENSEITVGTDVYALGAVLYELLAGTGPWRAGAGSVSSIIRRALRDEPVAPSKIARENGQSSVPSQNIAGDLDAIVLKAMRHAPADRYASVADLAEDVRRHQDLRPVRAHSGSTGYRVRRFVQRNRWGVASGAALLLALVAGSAGIAWQAHKAGVERDIARTELRRSEAVLNAMTLLFRNASDAGQIQSVTARDMLNISARNLMATMRPEAPDTVEAVLTLTELYIMTEDLAGAETFLRGAIKAGVGKGDAAATARMQRNMAQILVATGRLDEARPMLDAADKMFRSDPDRFRVEHQEMVSTRAFMLRASGDREGGIRLLADNLPEAEIAYADNPRELLTRYVNLGTHYSEAGRLDEAAALLARGEAFARRTNSMATVPGLMLQLHQGTVFLRRGNAQAALERYSHVAELRRELYGTSTGLGYDLMHRGNAELSLGRFADAVKTLDEAIPLLDNFLGPASQVAISARLMRVEALSRMGRVADAQNTLDRVRASLGSSDAGAAKHPQFLISQASLHIAQRKYGDARSELAVADRLLAEQGAAGTFRRQRVAQYRALLR